MRKSLIARILLALFALSLMSGMALAQDKAAKKPAKAAAAATPAADLLDINSATKTNWMLCRASARPIRRRSSTICQEDGSGE